MNIKNLNHIHFIGIGGVSMSGLALIMKKQGCLISGSDRSHSEITSILEKNNIKFYYNHDKSHITNPDLVVYTSAIPETNPELIEARSKNIKCIERSVFLGYLMKSYTKALTVTGTHGKTTTTGMVATILEFLDLDSTIMIGGILNNIGGNVKIGKSDYFLTEACEYKENFLDFFPSHAIILNIDEDHLDYFTGLDHIQKAFIKYGHKLKNSNNLIINNDDINCNVVKNEFPEAQTFGFSESSDFRASNLNYNNLGHPYFKLHIANKIFDVKLNVFGEHNVYNALSAIALCYSLGFPIEQILMGIEEFKGTHRRFEKVGVYNNALIIDDYAHHPTAILSTFQSLKSIKHKKVFAIFQPHTYSRTKALLNDFAKVFGSADTLILTDIYAAREIDDGSVSIDDLMIKIEEYSPNINIIHENDFNKISKYIQDNIHENDVCITIGAGNVYEIANSIVE